MPIAKRLRWFLERKEVHYEVIPHSRTVSSRDAARAAHVDPSQLAKSVLLEDERGYLVAVLPASRRLDLKQLRTDLGRNLELATEAEIDQIFDDCESGSLPPFGFVYGIPTVVDDELLHMSDVYFEAGEHLDMVHLKGLEFAQLMANAPHATLGKEPGSTDAAEPLFGESVRASRLDASQAHVFSLRSFGAGLRNQPEYEREGHTGVILVKTEQQRVLLEAAQAGVTLGTHVVHGPTLLYVLSGALDVHTPQATFRVGEMEMATLPDDEEREIEAVAESLFVLAIAPRRSAGERSAKAPARILIVANQTVGGWHLRRAVKDRMEQGPCELIVLSPSAMPRSPTMLATREALAEAKERLDVGCAQLREIGADVTGLVGDSSPMRAIQDVLAVEHIDEIVVSTLPGGVSEWLKMDLPSRVARRFGLPVTHIEAR